MGRKIDRETLHDAGLRLRRARKAGKATAKKKPVPIHLWGSRSKKERGLET